MILKAKATGMFRKESKSKDMYIALFQDFRVQ